MPLTRDRAGVAAVHRRRWPAPPRCGPSRPGRPARRSPRIAPRARCPGIAAGTPARARRRSVRGPPARPESRPGASPAAAGEDRDHAPTIRRPGPAMSPPGPGTYPGPKPSVRRRSRGPQIGKISSSRCEMNMTRCPGLSRSADHPNNRSDLGGGQSGGRLVEDDHAGVDSRARLAISTICWAAEERSRAFRLSSSADQPSSRTAACAAARTVDVTMRTPGLAGRQCCPRPSTPRSGSAPGGRWRCRPPGPRAVPEGRRLAVALRARRPSG